MMVNEELHIKNPLKLVEVLNYEMNLNLVIIYSCVIRCLIKLPFQEQTCPTDL